jgi:hypothetical protein
MARTKQHPEVFRAVDVDVAFGILAAVVDDVVNMVGVQSLNHSRFIPRL